MTDPVIHSSAWTGPPALDSSHHGAFTHRLGQASVTSDYERLVARRQPNPPLHPSLLLLGKALLLSPVFLWLGAVYAQFAVSDPLIVARFDWFIYWALGIAGGFVFLSKFPRGSSSRWVPTIVVAMVSASYALAIFYPYAAVSAHSTAIAATRERTFEVRRPPRCRGCSWRYVHQRADGSTVEGEDIGVAVPYGKTCTEVQRLEGDHGFAWVRVLERSPPPAHEVDWPIRREDCFSDKPVSSLRG
jgi:hypothetical protein